LDKLRSSIERQEAHFYVQEIEMQLQIEEGTFKNLTTDFAAIELREEKERKAFYENRRGNDRRDWKRPEREEQHRAQSLKIIEAQKDKIDKLKAKIEELKKKAA
jgi:hypothetical protein